MWGGGWASFVRFFASIFLVCGAKDVEKMLCFQKLAGSFGDYRRYNYVNVNARSTFFFFWSLEECHFEWKQNILRGVKSDWF